MRCVTVHFGNKQHNLQVERTKGTSANRWVARCRLPFNGLMSMPVSRSQGGPKLRTKDDDSSKGWSEKASQQSDGIVVLEGVASSTSVDWHGTEMSVAALDQMSRQFKSGVPYVPSHREDEWDQVFGHTIDARVELATVVNAAESDDPIEGHVLRVVTSVYTDDRRGKRLMDLVDRGQTIGWSIGGWFTELEVVTNDNDEIERMIIMGVELDHLATTRRPSNPDSWIGELSRSVGDALKVVRAEDEEEEEEEDDEAAEEEAAEDDESVGEEEYIGEEEAEEEQDEEDESEGETEAVEEEEAEEEEDEDEDEDDQKARGADDAPAYHLSDNETKKCGTCVFMAEGPWCNKFEFDAQPQYVCDDWSQATDEELFPADEPDSSAPEVPEGGYTDEALSRAASGDTDLMLAGEDEVWEWSAEDSGKVLSDDDWDRYRKAHFWFDPDNAEAKSGYKLPFAKMIGDDLKAVWHGVAAAMGALNGARGGVDISDDDAAEVYKKIKIYYERFDKEAPLLARSNTNDCIEQNEAALDRKRRTSEHSHEGNKAHRSPSSAHRSDFSPKQEEGAMSDRTNSEQKSGTPANGSSDIAATLAGMQGLLETLASRNVAVDANPTTVEPVAAKQDDSELMRSRIADLEKLVTKLTEAPQRQGRSHLPAQRRMDLTNANALVRDAEEALGGSSALVAVAKEQSTRRAADNANTPSRGQLESDLRAILNAALADGVITDPEARSNWR